jgi:NAD(P)-dependent dehydrogenase (short-subunit alcohol dehydrogenase family)
MSFAGRAAVVAGAGGGMGLNIANDLIAEGANVALLDIKPRPRDIRPGPGKSLYQQGDLSREDFVKAAIGQAAQAFGRLDYLVNTTGVLWFDRDRSILDMDMAVWDQVLAINLKSFALTARYAVPHMKRAGGGAMVHFSSIQALHGDVKAQDAYGASKGAIISLSKSIAIQFARDGIRSNAILPGATLSPMQARWEGKAELQGQIADSIPVGRIGTTQDQANAALFLLSDKASYITGTELIVDGGVRALP